MASIISSINWVANGERADSVTINRPLLEFIAKYETGDISLSTDALVAKVDTTIIDAAGIPTNSLIAWNGGVVELAQTSNKDNIFGLAVKDGLKTNVYFKGLIETSFLVPLPSMANEKYYLNELPGEEGKLTNVATGNKYIGKTVEVTPGVYKLDISVADVYATTVGGIAVDLTTTALADGDLITYNLASDTFVNIHDIDGGAY